MVNYVLRNSLKKEDITLQTQIQWFYPILIEKVYNVWAYVGIDKDRTILVGRNSLPYFIRKFQTLEQAYMEKIMLQSLYNCPFKIGGYDENKEKFDELCSFNIPGILDFCNNLESGINLLKQSENNLDIPDHIFEGLLAIKETKMINFFDTDMVKHYAIALNFPETAEWICTNLNIYLEGILKGFNVKKVKKSKSKKIKMSQMKA